MNGKIIDDHRFKFHTKKLTVNITISDPNSSRTYFGSQNIEKHLKRADKHIAYIRDYR